MATEHLTLKACPGCKEKKSAIEFGKESRQKSGLQSRCKECMRAKWRRRPRRRVLTGRKPPTPPTPEVIQKRKEKAREAGRRWRDDNRELFRKFARDCYWRNPAKYREKSRRNQKAARVQVIAHYSEGANRCACCGESQFEFLAIDHINGGGNRHRKEIASAGQGSGMVKWLIAHKFPEGYRILCHNCNHAYGSYGYCPHQQKNQTQT